MRLLAREQVDAMVRMKREDRERLIVAGAISFFAERGFAGQTRELARELGITQPLLYRYFPSKQLLIERVHEELFVRRWDPRWEALLADRRVPLRDRLRTFYGEFCRTIFSREWVRMFVYAGLDHVAYNRQVLDDIERRALRRIGVELRLHEGLGEVGLDRLTDAELEFLWELHGVAFYYHVRKHVYELPARRSLDEMVDLMTETFLAGAPSMLARALGPKAQEALKQTA